MKILLTTDTWSPTVNGVVTSVTSLRQELLRRGHQVRVLTLSGNLHTTVQNGVTALGSLDAGRVYPGARLRAPAVGEALQALADWRPDVVHTNCEFSTFGPARQIARAVGVPLIHTYHTVYEDYTHYFSPSRRMGRHAAAWFSRWVCNRADAVIAPTPKIQALLAGYGVRRPIQIIPTGIDLARFAVPRPPRSAPGPVLLYLGRLSKEKNVAELLTALPALPTATLLVVGDGPQRGPLQQQAAALGVADRVRFTGMAPPAQVPNYYAMADYFVSASTSEAQGLTYIEALAAGLPLLCRADPCLDALVTPGVTGWQYHTPAELTVLAAALPQGAARAPLAAAARQAAAPYALPAFGTAVETLYRQAITNKLPSPAGEAQTAPKMLHFPGSL